jgi:hypothetical protein
MKVMVVAVMIVWSMALSTSVVTASDVTCEPGGSGQSVTSEGDASSASAADVSDGMDSRKVEVGGEVGLGAVSPPSVGSAETSAGEAAPESDGEDSTKVEVGCEVGTKEESGGKMFADVPASESAEMRAGGTAPDSEGEDSTKVELGCDDLSPSGACPGVGGGEDPSRSGSSSESSLPSDSSPSRVAEGSGMTEV